MLLVDFTGAPRERWSLDYSFQEPDALLAARWQGFDLRGEVARLTALPVALIKDTAAACVAELVAGHGRILTSFLYVFVETFIGGGLVLDSHLRAGQHGNVGAFGSLLLNLSSAGAAAPPAQQLSRASLFKLEQMYAAAGLDSSATVDARRWPNLGGR